MASQCTPLALPAAFGAAAAWAVLAAAAAAGGGRTSTWARGRGARSAAPSLAAAAAAAAWSAVPDCAAAALAAAWALPASAGLVGYPEPCCCRCCWPCGSGCSGCRVRTMLPRSVQLCSSAHNCSAASTLAARATVCASPLHPGCSSPDCTRAPLSTAPGTLPGPGAAVPGPVPPAASTGSACSCCWCCCCDGSGGDGCGDCSVVQVKGPSRFLGVGIDHARPQRTAGGGGGSAAAAWPPSPLTSEQVCSKLGDAQCNRARDGMLAWLCSAPAACARRIASSRPRQPTCSCSRSARGSHQTCRPQISSGPAPPPARTLTLLLTPRVAAASVLVVLLRWNALEEWW